MRVDRGRLNWGVFFIILGAVPLAYHQGAVDVATLGGMWRLWPLILIGIGLGLVLSRTPAYFVGGLVVAACLGLVFGSLFAVGPSFGCDRNGSVTGQTLSSGSFNEISQVNLTLPCGHATISRSSDSDWHVNASHAGGADARVSGYAPTLSVRSGDDNNWWTDRGWNTWAIQLPAQLPTQTALSLSATTDAGDATLDIADVSFSGAIFTLNAGSLHVNLSRTGVYDFSLTTNAGSARLKLDAFSDITSGSLTTNAGELTLCVPPETGLQIKSTETLAGSNLSHTGLIRTGDTWRTQNYDQAQHKANLSATTNAGSFNVRIGGC